ncbi:tetratricopeptide repeat protein [uncultured Sphingomonas sp.]|uniref:tetratricopeptide repeat protein n=1 Tax=uncultured Sphingomonas sp. TaxID=158754 RepID=UPI0035CA9B32
MYRDLIARGLLLAGLLALGLFTLRVTAGNVFANRNPALAMRFSPDNARALGKSARTLVLTKQTPDALAETTRLARRALARNPAEIDAVVALGVTYDLAGRTRDAARLFEYSERLSRRDLATQLWLIEAAVRRDDVPGVLRHYDTALRTSRAAPSILFPILVQAVTGTDMIDPLSAVLARRPIWSYQYIQQLAQTGQDFDAMDALYKALHRRGGLVPEETIASASARMVEARRFDLAWSLYTTFNPGAGRGGVRDGAFRRIRTAPTPFDWTLSDVPALSLGAVEDEGGMLRFSTTSGAGGLAARQLLLLTRGPHRLSAKAYDVVAGDAERPELRVTCAGSAEPLARAPIGAADLRGSVVGAAFEVPGGCPAQWLELHVPAADGPTPVSGGIGRIAVR